MTFSGADRQKSRLLVQTKKQNLRLPMGQAHREKEMDRPRFFQEENLMHHLLRQMNHQDEIKMKIPSKTDRHYSQGVRCFRSGMVQTRGHTVSGHCGRDNLKLQGKHGYQEIDYNNLFFLRKRIRITLNLLALAFSTPDSLEVTKGLIRKNVR